MDSPGASPVSAQLNRHLKLGRGSFPPGIRVIPNRNWPGASTVSPICLSRSGPWTWTLSCLDRSWYWSHFSSRASFSSLLCFMYLNSHPSRVQFNFLFIALVNSNRWSNKVQFNLLIVHNSTETSPSQSRLIAKLVEISGTVYI